jgi:hypothetical protein
MQSVNLQAIRRKLHTTHAPKLVQESEKTLSKIKVFSGSRVPQKRRNTLSLHD